MKTLAKKLMAFALCLAMVLGLLVTSVGATQSAPKADESSDKVIYATDSTTTYVPAGYTYVYQSTDGRIYTRKATQDTYISGRTLSATEAKALASLSYGAESTITTDDGQTLVCREYDAAEAAAYSDAVKAILSGEDYDEGDKVTVVSEAYEKTDKVKVIVLLDEPSVSEMDGMTVELGKGLGQSEQAAVRKLKDGQSSVISAAKRKLGSSLEVTGQFSLVTNAIAATVSYGDMKTLSELPGVKKVFLSPCYSVPEINAVETDASQITTNMKFAASGMGANAAWDAGFDGTGMSVAVIDTGLCFENPTFDKEPTDAAAVAYTKDDIAAILESKTLHAEEMDETTAIDTVYYSSKVPFGFNYGDGEANFGSDDDTWMGHGSHVAGIIAGNLTEEDQEQFDMTYLGIAPEAQLIVMKVFDQKGDCYFDYLIAAIEDAIALGVDCANLSLGASSGPYYYEGVTEVYDAATAAGMMFEGTHTEIVIGYDYAGNCSAYTISGSLLEENISLASETDSIYIGDELTIRNTDTEDYTALLNWEVSDPEIAEIVTSDDSSVTIKGLKRGDVVVTASIGDFKKSITIHVLDKDYENQKYITLTSETDTIYIGDELMVKNAAADEHPTHMTWTVSDPTIAEIVSSDDSSVTIKGLKYGDVVVTGGTVDEFKKSITIHVRDKSYEDLANGFKDISGHWAEKTMQKFLKPVRAAVHAPAAVAPPSFSCGGSRRPTGTE